MSLSLSPQDAWQPLAAGDWNIEAVRHLYRRAGWSARPAEVERAEREGLTATLERLFPQDPPLLAKPKLISRLEDGVPQMQRDAAKMAGEEKLRAQRELQERGRLAVQELTIKWL